MEGRKAIENKNANNLGGRARTGEEEDLRISSAAFHRLAFSSRVRMEGSASNDVVSRVRTRFGIFTAKYAGGVAPVQMNEPSSLRTNLG